MKLVTILKFEAFLKKVIKVLLICYVAVLLTIALGSSYDAGEPDLPVAKAATKMQGDDGFHYEYRD